MLSVVFWRPQRTKTSSKLLVKLQNSKNWKKPSLMLWSQNPIPKSTQKLVNRSRTSPHSTVIKITRSQAMRKPGTSGRTNWSTKCWCRSKMSTFGTSTITLLRKTRSRLYPIFSKEWTLTVGLKTNSSNCNWVLNVKGKRLIWVNFWWKRKLYRKRRRRRQRARKTFKRCGEQA